jgi:type I restriction enzyme R subunit
MTESVKDEITVRIVYEGRAAKVLLDNAKLKEIEDYYNKCADDGANEYQVEESKKATAKLSVIIGDPDRIKAVAEDFVNHYEKRVSEGATLKGKAMFVCSSRPIAYQLYQEILALRPQWGEVKVAADSVEITEQERKEIKPIERLKMIMTRGKDDPKELYDLLGTKDDRKELDRQFKNAKSNFKIAIVVDMWLTGFDVPFLDTMYIDKPIQRHNLIQTISRVNRKFAGKEKGLVVDYFGIKSQMNLALALYNQADSINFEDIDQSVIIVKDQLDLLDKLFHNFDNTNYFKGKPLQQLACLNEAAEFVQLTQSLEKRFMGIVKRLKSAYDICCGSEALNQKQRDYIHFYIAVRSIVYKLTKGNAPDTAQMNAKVREMIKEALKSDGVEEIFKLGEQEKEIDIFDDDYLKKIEKIKLPNTKIKLLQQLLAKAIEEFKKTNKAKGVDFSKKFKTLVDMYNERKEKDVLQSVVLEDFTNEIIEMFYNLKKEKESFADMGINFEEKAFYDILKQLANKYDFSYPEDKLIYLAKEVKLVVDDKTKYTDWNHRTDIKAELKAHLIVLLAENDYPPIDRDEVYKEIFEQAENFKKYSKS